MKKKMNLRSGSERHRHFVGSLMRNYFPKRPSGAPLHTLSKLYDVPVGFVTPPPPILRLNIAFLRSPKGGCCSISDDLSCSFNVLVQAPTRGHLFSSPEPKAQVSYCPSAPSVCPSVSRRRRP